MISYPSVTSVISPYADFSRIPADVLQKAADRGTAVHDICARIARGEFVMGIDPEYAGYVESFRRWFDKVVATVILVEERLTDLDFGFHGELDLLVKAKHGEIMLIDLKTPISKIKSWKVQLAGYKHLVEKSEYPNPDRAGSLRLSPDGKAPTMDWYEGSAENLNVFLSALNVYRFFNS